MKRFIDNDWFDLLHDEFQKPYYQDLRQFLKAAYQSETVYPPMAEIWQAFQQTPYHRVKVVILGQDPYHGVGQAHGMSFSVRAGVKFPPSLKNIFKELVDDIGAPMPTQGDLTPWAQQGVFLLNTVLTVRAGEAFSHHGRGWEVLTDAVISLLNARQEPVVFILWGKPAMAKQSLIDTTKHRVISSPHPSPLSAHRGFFGSKPFSRANAMLQESGLEVIDWRLP